MQSIKVALLSRGSTIDAVTTRRGVESSHGCVLSAIGFMEIAVILL